MARRHRKAPSFELMWKKRGEAEHFLFKLKQHRELQRQPEKPPPHEFSYNLSAFLNASRSIGKMMAWKSPEWWKHLGAAERILHDRIWDMRDETVYEGHTETIVQAKEVPIRPDYRYLANRAHGGFFFSNPSMFGEATTYAYTHAINLGGDERDVVELCEQYLAILVRELRGLEKASQPIPSALAQDQESGRASAEAD